MIPYAPSNQLGFDFLERNLEETNMKKIGFSVVIMVMTAMMAGAVNINWVVCGLPNPSDDILGDMAGKIAVLVQGDNRPGIEP